MKKFSLLMMFAAFCIFSLGCEPAPKPSTSTPPVESDHMTSDSGEEKPSAPAAETKPESKPEDKPEEKPATPAAEPKPEEKPAAPAGDPKPDEKPADAPK